MSRMEKVQSHDGKWKEMEERIQSRRVGGYGLSLATLCCCVPALKWNPTANREPHLGSSDENTLRLPLCTWVWTKLWPGAKQALPWRHSLNDSNSRIFLYSCECYNPKTNICSSDLLNSTVTTVHWQEMLFPVQILNDRFCGVWYWAGKTTCKDPFYL